MTVKALRRQLMAAIAMVVVSVVALSSSTYAWFAANNKVTAEGMKVQATAEGGIEIRYNVLSTENDDGTAYKTTDSANMSAAHKLYPTSTLASASDSTVSSNWYHANAAAANAFNANQGTYSVLALNAGNSSSYIFGSTTEKQVADQFYDNDGRQYYLVNEFNIRSVSSTKPASRLKVESVSATLPASANSGELDKSLRVAVVCGDKSVIYAPVTGASATYNVATSVDSNGNATLDGNVKALAANVTSEEIAATVPAKGNTTFGGVDVRIYVYYEGEDSNHFSNNLTSIIDEISVSVNFIATID